uniref:Uncharacterized protein n=1 Tax=Romanomermis culicivorax TaxID=13658 RepID=A0A915IVP0_ROMCU
MLSLQSTTLVVKSVIRLTAFDSSKYGPSGAARTQSSPDRPGPSLGSARGNPFLKECPELGQN